MRLKRLISAFIACAMLATFMPMQAFAAPKFRVNDTEFHIMSMNDMKQVVSNYYPADIDTGIEIEKIYVHAGNETAKAILTNYYMPEFDAWKVENTNDIITDTKVDGLTIFAKVDGAEKEVEVGIDPVQLTHDVGSGYITQISLKVSLEYDFNGGTGSVPQNTKYVEHDLVQLPGKNDLSRDGAVLLGFSENRTEALVSSKEDAEAAKIISGDFRIDEDTTLYAVWAEDKNKNGEPDYSETKYTVTYKDGAGSTVFEDKVTSNLLKGDPTPVAPTNLEREGYVFTDWNPKREETVTGENHNIIYTAQWDELFTLSYNLNEGVAPEECKDVFENIEIRQGVRYILPTCKPTREGYIFSGWKANDTAGTVYQAGESINMTNDVTLSAQWQKEPVAEKVVVNICFVDVDKPAGEDFVSSGNYQFTKGMHNYSELVEYVPEGYNMVAAGMFNATADAKITVGVKNLNNTVIMNIRFMDEDTNEFVSGGDYFLPAGVQNYSILEKHVPDGYKMTVSGDFTVTANGTLDVPVKKIAVEPSEIIMNIRFIDEDTNEFVSGGDYFLPAGVQNYSILEKHVPDGYKMTVSGDFTVTANGTLDVPVKKIAVEPSEIIMNIRFMYGDEFIAGGDYFIPEGVQNYSILEEYVPEGYRMAVSGDFMAADGGELEVPLEKADAEPISVTIRYIYDGSLVKEVSRKMIEGVHSYRELEQDVPEGYTMAVAGDFYAKQGTVIIVALTKEEVIEYMVTVDGSYADNPGAGKHKPGETVTINAGTRDNYSFGGWDTDDNITFADADNRTTTFTMPNKDVTVTATWDRNSGGGAYHPEAGDNNDRDRNDNDDEDTEEIIDEEVPLADTPWLNTEDHYAYIVGYSEDGTVRPNASITRAEVATIFFRLLTDEARDQFWMTTNNFSDVAADAWYNNAVSTMVNMGIIQGYEDGTFRPNANITRAEFAAIAARFMASGYGVEDDLFTDIANHWARESINDAAMAGWINGYEDGTFRPDAAITRAEAVTMVNNVLGRKPHADHMLDSMIKWTDNMDTSAWYYAAIQEATNSHDYDLFEDAEYETWTALQENRDWSALERDWANAHVA